MPLSISECLRYVGKHTNSIHCSVHLVGHYKKSTTNIHGGQKKTIFYKSVTPVYDDTEIHSIIYQHV